MELSHTVSLVEFFYAIGEPAKSNKKLYKKSPHVIAVP